jgi:hypothetical protein
VLGIFRHLDHRSIAGGQNRSERAEAQIKWEIPGDDDPDDAERLRDDAIARERVGHDVDVSALRLHPLLQFFGGVGDCFQDNEIFAEQGLELRPVAVVGVDRCDQLILVVFEELRERLQVGHALIVGWLRRRQVSRTLGIETRLKFSGNRDRMRTGHRRIHDVPFLLVSRVLSERNGDHLVPCLLGSEVL